MTANAQPANPRYRENQMNRNRFAIPALLFFSLTAIVITPWRAHAQTQDAKTPYATMTPLDQYIIPDRNAEIALARSAAPPSTSKDATVMVLEKHGYETAVQGTNGFVCMVDRAWMNAFDSPEFWNPNSRGPVCYNPQAARSVMPIDLLRTKFVLAGQSKDEIRESMKAAIEKNELPPVEPGAMAYMLSKQGRLNDRVGHWHPHLMFYVSLKDGKTWGAGEDDSPILINPHFNGAPEPVTEFIVVVSEWSDGTPAPMDH
jgi:hypothetical protein